MISLRRSIDLSIGSISSSKMRSVLTTLGIIIGVAAVIANVSLGASFNEFFNDEIGAVGSNFIVIYSQGVNVFFDKEIDLIRNTPGVEGVSPVNQQMARVTYLSTSRQIDIQGVIEDYGEVANLKMDAGSFLSDKDQFVAVLGSEVAYEKFDKKVSVKNPIEITFRREDGGVVTQKFIVKGIIQDPNTAFVQTGVEPEIRIFIPINTMNQMLGKDDYGGFFIKASSLDTVRETADEIDNRLARNLGVSTRELENDDTKPYVMFDQIDAIEQTDQVSTALTSLLTSVALISLIVGSIGIMNIMLVTVTERTREIGLMKSLGYTRKDVLTLFLIESTILSLLGGICGTALGIGVAFIANYFLDLPNVFPVNQILIGFIVSILVGLVAGIYPANKAAQMDPVEAFRHE
ncbi:ABC-type antimicrobial peptide transport system, permease component [Methanomethylovorans hollandica DSM 15978]|jgi:putative ABC transport system permease protein|uniref:ABC-type antimicrobial peptide transport system, permease component n=1 Tax=Methanomethylovorans hollandica (strain DSM 15978 / NBRC 107637 / DMS1) TaxID=867904 RepID=L0KX50_METHD|nr:ABC transporter permease [Methanomethylovorans hollandica]AGB48653.1 ABC-type antimicrobial peptide transport system, permease component [Methanomethylovorans hollandica DSM 15978]